MTTTPRWLMAAALAALLLAAPSCRPFWRRKAKQIPPTPIPPAQAPPSGPQQMPEPPELQPDLDYSLRGSPASVLQVEIAPPEPTVTPRRPRRSLRTRPSAAAEEPAAETPPAGVPPPAPQPRLGEIFTPGELREHAESLDRSLRETRGILAQIFKRKLTAAQTQTAARIQTFLRQAEQARASDLAAAASLARRAELLARDLLNQLP